MAEKDSELRTQIREAIERGIVFDIYRADEAIHLFTAISDNAAYINSDGGYANMCHAIQNACIATLILSTARIYDKPKNYDLRNLPWVLRKLASDGTAEEFPDVTSFDAKINEWSTRFNQVLGDNKGPLGKLKSVRDKQLAHNELTAYQIKGPTWGEIENLLNETKQLVAEIADELFSSPFVDHGDSGVQWMLDFDARRASVSLRRVFEMLNEVGNGQANAV